MKTEDPDQLMKAIEEKYLAVRRAYAEIWRDCCDCIHVAEIKSSRCRDCFDNPARISWEATWANNIDETKSL